MNYKNYNDYELVYMVNEDGSYGDLLYQKYKPVLLSIVNEFFQNYRNYGYDYDDFLQEASIAFFQSISKFDESKGSLFYTFMTLCVRRKLMSFCRNISNSNKNIPSGFFVDIDEFDVLDDKNDLNRLVHDFEIDQIIRNVLFNLPIQYSSILELKMNGFSYCEISILLDIPKSTVEFRNRHSKKMVETYLTNYYSNKT